MSRPQESPWRAVIVGLSVPYAVMLLAGSANRWLDLIVLVILLALAFLIPRLAQRLGRSLPFPDAPDPEPPLPRAARWGIAALAVVALIAWWPVLAHDVDRSDRWLIVAGSHGDEGRYKPVLEDMFRRGTLDPHPKQIFFNYGHLHINLVMIPLLPLRGLLSDPATTALLAARVVSFLALIAALIVGGAWCWRRWGAAPAVAFALAVGLHPIVVDRAGISQTPDTLVLLTMLLASLHAARFAAQPNRRDIVAATCWAGAAAGVKYVGLFFVPILVPLLLVVWRQAAGSWPRPGAAVKVVLGFALLFLLCFLACSPYHLFHPQAVAVMFVKAGHEYFPGAFTPGLALRGLLGVSLLDLTAGLAAALAIPVVLRSAWRSLDDSLSVPAETSWARGDLVLLAWGTLWVGYVSFFMHNAANTLPHLLFPALPILVFPLARLTRPPDALPEGPRRAWPVVFIGLGVVLALLPVTIPRRHGPDLKVPGRLAELAVIRGRHRSDPRVDREPLEWFAGHRIPYDARVLVDAELFLPRVWPYFMHGHGPLSRRRLGLFTGLPEVVVTLRPYKELWRDDTSDFPDADAIRSLYRDLDGPAGAPPYRKVATLARYDVYAVPWLGGRELLDASAEVAPPFRAVPRRVRNPLWNGIERAARAYANPDGNAFPQNLELKLVEPGKPAWLVLLWDTREVMGGWFRDEAYATGFRLEAWVADGWRQVFVAREHRPDAYGGAVVPLPANTPRSDRWRLVIEGWHGPGPVKIEHFALPEPPATPFFKRAETR